MIQSLSTYYAVIEIVTYEMSEQRISARKNHKCVYNFQNEISFSEMLFLQKILMTSVRCLQVYKGYN